jgi:hypothetical protein
VDGGDASNDIWEIGHLYTSNLIEVQLECLVIKMWSVIYVQDCIKSVKANVSIMRAWSSSELRVPAQLWSKFVEDEARKSLAWLN